MHLCVFVGEHAGAGIQPSFTLLHRGMRVKRKSGCVSGVCWKSVCVYMERGCVYMKSMLEECMCVSVHGRVWVCDVEVGRESVCREYQECTWESVCV